MNSCCSFSRNLGPSPLRAEVDSSPQATSSKNILRKGPPVRLSNPAKCVRIDMAERTLLNIKNPCMKIFLDSLIVSLQSLKKVKEIVRLKTLKRELLCPFKLNIETLKLAIVNEKNPIIQALSSLDGETISHLESKILVPNFFHNFFKELEFQAKIYRAKRLPACPETIDALLKIAEELFENKEKTKALKMLSLIEFFVHHKSITFADKIFSFRKIAGMLYLAGEAAMGLEALKEIRKFIENQPTIEDQVEDLKLLAQDFIIIGEESEVIDIINTLTQTSYFTSDDKISAFQEIFSFMHQHDDIDSILRIIEGSQNSLEKDSVLKILVSWILEDTGNADRALEVAGLIQDKQTRDEAINEIPKEKDLAGEIEA